MNDDGITALLCKKILTLACYNILFLFNVKLGIFPLNYAVISLVSLLLIAWLPTLFLN